MLGVQELNIWLGNVDGSSGLGNDSLGADALASFVGFGLLLVVFSHSVEEVNARGGQLEVLHAHVNALRNDSVPDLLVDDDTDGSGVDVEDAASPAVVVLVRHALVDRTINDDVNDVTVTVGSEGLGNVDGTFLPKTLSELMSSPALVAVAVSHLW